MLAIDAYDQILSQVRQVIALMEENAACSHSASPDVYAQRMALQRDMLNTVKGLEAIANRIAEPEPLPPAVDKAIAKHEAQHPGCNERYWYERAMRAEQAAAHFFHCTECASELCGEGKRLAVALGLVV